MAARDRITIERDLEGYEPPPDYPPKQIMYEIQARYNIEDLEGVEVVDGWIRVTGTSPKDGPLTI